MSKIRILIADDHAVLRSGLRQLLNNQPDMEVVAEAANGEEAIWKSLKHRPDVVLMDISMPGRSGTGVTEEMTRLTPGVKVIALTMHEDANYLYGMIKAGASGYIPKKAADTELIEAVRTVYRGESFIHSSMADAVISGIRNPEAQGITTGDILSDREREVLKLIALGYTNQQIADTLFVSVKSIETYKKRIRDKLGIQSRAELVRYAVGIGLVSFQ